uniref:EGF-like domain-containing protein n=1 Tax=Cyclophora tenuis TaxID=216820 RepID=A0A7S1D8P9_CYCTE
MLPRAHLNVTYSDNFEHCVCPTGYVGVKCEVKVQVCGEGQHACFHGSVCADDEGSHTCDCAAGETLFHQFAGPFCEHKSSTFCTLDGKPGHGRNSHAFCVNNGRCLAFVDDTQEHVGCECGDEYEGKHCEIVKQRLQTFEEDREHQGGINGDLGLPNQGGDTLHTRPNIEHRPRDDTVVPRRPSPSQQTTQKSGLSTGGALTIAFVVAMLTGSTTGILLWMRQKRRHQTEKAVIQSTFQPAAERRIAPKQLSMTPKQDFPAPYDDTEMVNVEIL